MLQKGADQFLIYWDLAAVTDQTYSQSISIEATDGITIHVANLDKLDSFYLYTIESPDPCVEYHITVSIETDDNIICSDSISTHIKGKYFEILNAKRPIHNTLETN